MVKRYQIIKCDPDIGVDEGMNYKTIAEAMAAAKELSKEYASIFIYDYKTRSVIHAFNGTPDGVFSKDVDTSRIIYHWT